MNRSENPDRAQKNTHEARESPHASGTSHEPSPRDPKPRHEPASRPKSAESSPEATAHSGQSSGSVQIERPGRKPELESDVHPQRKPGEELLPNESDNIPGDENDPGLVEGKP